MHLSASRFGVFCALTVCLTLLCSVPGQAQDTFSFRKLRETHRTKLFYAPDEPPPDVFKLVKYRSENGQFTEVKAAHDTVRSLRDLKSPT